MIVKNKTNNYFVLLPETSIQYYESFILTFENVFVVKKHKYNIYKLKKILLKTNDCNLVIVDYFDNYENLIKKLNINSFISVFTFSSGELSLFTINSALKNILDLYKQKVIHKIVFLDNQLTNLFKKHINCSTLMLRVKQQNNNSIPDRSKTIGIISDQKNLFSSFYNSLCAVKLLHNYACKINRKTKITNEFCKTFKIKKIVSKNYIEGNYANLYINFSTCNIIPFLKSMDLGIPCIIGNNSWINDWPTMKKYLYVESDDNIVKISEKINGLKAHINIIFREYYNFRKKYIELADETIKNFNK